MRLRRRVGVGALLGMGGWLFIAAPAAGQIFDRGEQSLGLTTDPISRSTRLYGMGRLTLADDIHNRIAMWDFALNPVGIADADTSSTFEALTGTGSASAVTDLFPSVATREVLAGRVVRTGMEGWRRAGGTAYGVRARWDGLRLDQPSATDTEIRQRLANPSVDIALNGDMPYVKPGRMKYALTLFYDYQTANDELRALVYNPAGQYISRNGATLTPPNFFIPDQADITTRGGSAAASYKFGHWLEAALLGRLVGIVESSTNSGGRNTSEITGKLRGDRPFPVGEGTLIGHIGRDIDWGLDGSVWHSSAEERWAFTTSAGIGQNPLAGRGKLDELEGRGSDMRSRVRWVLGSLELGGSFNTSFRQGVVFPPDESDPTSLNKFLYVVYNRPGADTLALPDSVAYQHIEDRVWQAAGGFSWHLPGHRGLAGAEYHAEQDERTGIPIGLGPRMKEWDVRAGVEYRCTPVLTGRGGYIYTSRNQDDLTVQNEYLSNAGTLGFTLRPKNAIWNFDTAYSIEWWRADYGTPAQPRGSRQQLLGQLRWQF